MIPEFLWRAWLAGLGVALVAGPLGCFVVWRRMAYFGDTLAHSALLGVTLGLLLEVEVMLGVALTGAVAAALIVLLQQQRRLATDTLLGILAHSSLAIGLVALAFLEDLRVDLLAYLFGDVLAVAWSDVLVVLLGGGLVLGLLALLWRWLLFATVHEELARAEGAPVLALRLGLMLLMALVVAVAMKIVGILLITSMLIIPAAAARQLARSPEAMAAGAALLGALAVTAGLGASYALDTPAGPSIVVAALVVFVVLQLHGLARARLARP